MKLLFLTKKMMEEFEYDDKEKGGKYELKIGVDDCRLPSFEIDSKISVPKQKIKNKPTLLQ